MKNRRVEKAKLNIKKVILFVMIIILLSICLIIMLGGRTSSYVEKTLKTVYVSHGETLWEIARIESKNNEYYAKHDIRYILKDIKQLNNLNSSNLYPGQELLIPSL